MAVPLASPSGRVLVHDSVPETDGRPAKVPPLDVPVASGVALGVSTREAVTAGEKRGTGRAVPSGAVASSLPRCTRHGEPGARIHCLGDGWGLIAHHPPTTAHRHATPLHSTPNSLPDCKLLPSPPTVPRPRGLCRPTHLWG